jgi:hypothetical protein
MGKSDENFRDNLKLLAEIADLTESNELFDGGDVQVKITLEKDKYDSILRNFRQIDWKSEKFFINIGNTSFKFVLKK